MTFDYQSERNKLRISNAQLKELIAALGFQEPVSEEQFEILAKAVQVFKNGGVNYQQAADAARASGNFLEDSSPENTFQEAAKQAAAQAKAYQQQLDMQQAAIEAEERAIVFSVMKENFFHVLVHSDKVMNNPRVLEARNMGEKIAKQTREEGQAIYPLEIAAQYAAKMLPPQPLLPEQEPTKQLSAARED